MNISAQLLRGCLKTDFRPSSSSSFSSSVFQGIRARRRFLIPLLFKPALTLGILGLLLTNASGFSTDQCAMTRRFDLTSVTTNALISVTALLTNGTATSLRGFYFVDHIPAGLTVTTLDVTLNGLGISDYTVESGSVGEVYPGCISYRWILETPTAFTASNAVAASGVAQITYSLASAQTGSFSLQHFSWNGFHLSPTNTAFGYNATNDVQLLSFTPSPPPTVTFTAPTNGATVAGQITMAANATADGPVVGVQFQVDGVNLGVEITTPPYETIWDSTSETPGTFTLTATARDLAGASATATVTVNLTALPIPIGNVAVTMVAAGLTAGRFHFAFLSEPGVTYVVEYKTELSAPDWQTLTSVSGTGELVPVEDPTPPSGSRFYRIRNEISAAARFAAKD